MRSYLETALAADPASTSLTAAAQAISRSIHTLEPHSNQRSYQINKLRICECLQIQSKKNEPGRGPELSLASRRLLRLIEPDLFQDVLNSGEMVVENFTRHVEQPEDGPVSHRIID